MRTGRLPWDVENEIVPDDEDELVRVLSGRIEDPRENPEDDDEDLEEKDEDEEA